MSFKFTKFLFVAIVIYFSVNEVIGKEIHVKGSDLEFFLKRFGIQIPSTRETGREGVINDFARFGIPIASTQGNSTMSTTDISGQLMHSLPVMKLNLLSSILTFLAPLLQGLLVTSLILFTITATAAIICQTFDCVNALGLNNSHASGNPYFTSTGYHQHSNGNPFPRRRLDVGRKPWITAQTAPLPLQHLEEALDKFGEK